MVRSRNITVVCGTKHRIGVDGAGVPAGGTTGQVLTKASDGNFDTRWSEPAPARAEVRRMVRTTPQPLVREIMYHALLFRPKGHVFYLSPDAEWVQVAGVLPNRGQIRAAGTPKRFTDEQRDYAVPVFDARYVESMHYELRWDRSAGTPKSRCTLAGEIRLKLRMEAFRANALRLRLLNYGTYEVQVGGTFFPGESNIPRTLLQAADGEVVIRTQVGNTLHLRILADDSDALGLFSGKYLRVDERMQFVPVGTPEDTRPPYVGRINPRSPKSGSYPGGSVFGHLVDPQRFKSGYCFSTQTANDPREIVDHLGFGDAWQAGYRLFVRIGSKRGPMYHKLGNGEFGKLFGEPRVLHRRGDLPHRTLCGTAQRQDDETVYFRVSFIDCCIARVRFHPGSGFETTYSMERAYPRFHFRIRAILRNNYDAKKRGFEEADRWQAQK